MADEKEKPFAFRVAVQHLDIRQDGEEKSLGVYKSLQDLAKSLDENKIDPSSTTIIYACYPSGEEIPIKREVYSRKIETKVIAYLEWLPPEEIGKRAKEAGLQT